LKIICHRALIYLALIAFGVRLGEAENQADFELPSWKSEHAGRPYFPGGGLWPIEPAQKKHKTAPETKAAENEQPVLKRDYVILRKKDIAPIGGGAVRDIPDDLPPLDSDLYQKYFASSPSQFLIDPQNLMTEQKANDVLRFLEFHAQQSGFVIYGMVFGKNQVLPEHHDWSQLHHKWFNGANSILVVYHLQNPESLQLYFNPSIISQLPESVVSRIRSCCVAEARLADDGPDQFEKIAIELSIQAFGLEKLQARSPISKKPVLSHTTILPSPAPLRNSDSSLVSPALIKSLIIGSTGILLLSLVFFLMQSISTQRLRQQQPILFPGLPKQERLGGLHCGGTYIGISFDLERDKS
jgi:hypothetical protein